MQDTENDTRPYLFYASANAHTYRTVPQIENRQTSIFYPFIKC